MAGVVESIIQLFVSRRPWVGPIRLDASLAEDHALEFEVAEAPIASTSVVADHVLRLPRRLVITALVGQHDELSPLPVRSRPARTWRRLRELADLREPVDVVTTLEIYANMIIESLTAVRDVSSSGVLRATITLRELQVATVDVESKIADAALDLGLAEADLGTQGATAQIADVAGAVA